ncbi:MAG: class I SAM-dependent methyltransferase [Pirellulales bacterium]|nr:class I SAM-dependent methyltransferase [Pirellulales bacterium]
MPQNLAEIVYPECRFGGFTRVDGTVAYYSRVHALLRPGDVVLDLGCGRGAQANDPSSFRRQLRDLRGNGRTVIGIDIDRNAQTNPLIDEFRLIEDVEHWPIDDASIDLIHSDNVLEHVQEPDHFFTEAHRVLKRGGHLTLRTPNAWGYASLLARLVPNRWHAKVVHRVQHSSSAQDVFPTVYRCNSPRKLRRALARHGFNSVVYAIESEPSYLDFSQLAFRVAAAMHTVLPPIFRSKLVAFACKTAEA